MEAQRIKVASKIGNKRDNLSSRDNSTTNQQKPKEAPAVAAVASMDTNPDYKPRIIDLLDDVDKGYQFGEYNVEAFVCDAYDDMNQYKSVYE